MFTNSKVSGSDLGSFGYKLTNIRHAIDYFVHLLFNGFFIFIGILIICMAGRTIYHFAAKVFCLLIAFTFSMPSSGALPGFLSLKDHTPRHSLIKSTPSSFHKRAAPFSTFVFLSKKHPKALWKGVKGIAKNYILTHKPLLVQDGKLSEADQKAKTSLILGVIALALSWLPYTLIPAMVLAVLSILMDRKAREMGSEKKTGKSLAIVALAVSAMVLLLSVLIVVSFFTGINLLFNW